MNKIDWKNHLVELVVVFIGITAAFALNNWNEKNKEDKLEQKYLRNLTIDLDKDITELNELIEVLKVDTLANNKVLNLLKLGKTKKDSIFPLIIRMNTISKFQPHLTTFESLENSGDLSLIENFELKNKITETYNFYKTVKEIDDAHYTLAFNYWLPFFYENLDFMNLNNSKMYFIETQKFKNLIIIYRASIFQQIARYDSALTKCKKLKSAIKDN